jgi:hypothetical protein
VVSAPSGGRSGNDRNNPNAAIPVYLCPQPTGAASYPNDRTNPQGAVPVKIIFAGPDGKAIPVYYAPAPTSPFAGAIPVWDIANPLLLASQPRRRTSSRRR